MKSPKKELLVDDQVIQDFCAIIENTPPEEWLKRSNALQSLVSSIPPDAAAHSSQWFNNAKTLRHLAFPIGNLLKDARSTVVKRTCENVTLLFNKCGVDARYLLKDLMVTIIGVHAQTVQVIRTYVQAMVLESIPIVPCKAAMPLWLDKLKTDKRKTVREACALYLTKGLETWQEDPAYMSNDIWIQVGTLLIRTLRDPSPSVREIVKQGLDTIRTTQPEIWEKLVQDPQGPAAQDAKLQRYLLKMGVDIDTTDDTSVVSSRSMTSNVSRGSNRVAPSNTSNNGQPHQSKSHRGALGPPVRVTSAPFVPVVATAESPSRKSSGPRSPSNLPRARSPKIISQSGTYAPHRTQEISTFDNQGPFIAGVAELKEKAKRRSRRSSAMQERWRALGSLSTRSTGSLLEEANSLLDRIESDVRVPNSFTGMVDPLAIEHLNLAQTLLDAHREHMDKIMETLRLEMDTMKEFEELMISNDTSTPSEEQVLDYFESVGLCLDQRVESGKELQIAMDRISQGAD